MRNALAENQATREAAFHRFAAYHEAGHAVVASRHGILGERVVLDSGEDPSREDAGEAALKRPANIGELRRLLPAYVLASVAGREAQLIAIERYSPEEQKGVDAINAQICDRHDRDYVANLLEHLGEPSDKAAAEERYDAAAPEARRILEEPGIWAAVEAVAKLLLEHGEATREQVEEIVAASAIE